jgi:hypothetical protein
VNYQRIYFQQRVPGISAISCFGNFANSDAQQGEGQTASPDRVQTAIKLKEVLLIPANSLAPEFVVRAWAGIQLTKYARVAGQYQGFVRFAAI